MSEIRARGACPSLPAPMETGDGLLARIAVTARVTLEDFIGLCATARAHGNGTIEVSGRGTLQVRGLSPLSAPRFAAGISTLDIELGDGVPVLADPLPDDPAALIDTESFAAELRAAIAEEGLIVAPKVSVVVDGGGSIDLEGIAADIRLNAVAGHGGPGFALAITGDAATALPIGTVAREDAVAEVLALLGAIAAKGPAARAADLPQARMGNSTSFAKHRGRAHPIGEHALKGGAFALGLGLAFGHAQAGALIDLAGIAKANGAAWVRPAPDRALLFGPLGKPQAEATRLAASRLGFIAEASDPRRRIVACSGAPLCAHGLIAARALAAEIARNAKLAGDGIALHISGCAKGCAHPRQAPLTIVGTAQGCGIVRDGTARDKPSAYADEGDLLKLILARESVHA